MDSECHRIAEQSGDIIRSAKGKFRSRRACTGRLLNLDPARHEEAAIYEVNQRIPNVIGLRSNPVISIAAQKASSEAAVLARGGF
ncbi:hypothetical protein OCV62_07880 [Gallintestinimicrobium propionicum]|uniref:hypothetical protein n=1 Tax=Gallintestinimicrobium propionicum TaxID=2981770 RepID=UPI0021D27585|nr:hypothetical protein [Gallintestinimicrobium propionicum]MCU6689896.1 hypothetical protein [Gallintestinimicrobium propionicum]